MDDYSPDEMLVIYEDIKNRVHARYEMRTQFFGNLAGFIGAFIVALIINRANLMPGWLGSILPWIMGFWLIGLCVQAANWFMFELRERAVRKEIERAGFGLYAHNIIATKRKRRDDARSERLVQLSDDGEIMDIYSDDAEYEYHQR